MLKAKHAPLFDSCFKIWGDILERLEPRQEIGLFCRTYSPSVGEDELRAAAGGVFCLQFLLLCI